MHRRRFLAALTALPFASAGRAWGAEVVPPALRSVSRDARGTTLALALEHAPFPCAGSGYRDDTVLVFVPSHFRFHEAEGLAALVHFHGHNTTAEKALVAHELREQLADSRQNALLIVPQLAVMAADSSCGKLESPGGLARLLREALCAAASAGGEVLGESGFPGEARVSTLCLSAHSGGYHAAAAALRVGGAEVRETYLFDALYAERATFRDWVLARNGEPLHRRHKLVSYFVGGTQTETENSLLRAELEHAGVLVGYDAREGELSRGDVSHVDALFVRTGLWHSNVTWEHNALRDCLFASALPRHLPTTWFARKNGARPLDVRQR